MRAQLEESRRYQEQVLNTVYWALGSLITVLAALVGFGWFANFRVYERDKQVMAQALKAELAESLQAQMKDLESRFAALGSALETKSAEGIVLVRTEVNSKTDAVQSTLANRINELTESLASTRKALQNSILELEFKAEVAKYHEMDEQIPRNRLQDSVSLLELAIKLNAPGYLHLEDTLDLVAADIGRVEALQAADPRESIDSFLLGQLFEVLNKVKGPSAAVAQQLSKRVGLLRAGR